MDGENTALARGALDGNPAAVDLDDMLDDGKPEAGAPELPAPGLVHPVEALKDPGQVLDWDPDPGVPDPD